LRALARTPDGMATWPEFARELREAAAVVVPPLILSEVDYFLAKDRVAARRLLAEVLDPATTYELEPLLPEDLVRALQLDAKFGSLELGLVDASVAAVAERRGIYRVLTTDHNDFGPVRIGPQYRQPLVLLP